jgi:hypothetical protein
MWGALPKEQKEGNQAEALLQRSRGVCTSTFMHISAFLGQTVLCPLRFFIAYISEVVLGRKAKIYNLEVLHTF